MRVRALVPAAAVMLVPCAAAAICGVLPPVYVWPHGSAGDAPTNARVVVTMRSEGRVGVMLETAPTRGAARGVVPTKEETWTTGTFDRVVLVPRAPLAPHTAFEVWSARGEILGAFATGDAPDATPPTWAGVKSVRYFTPNPRAIGLECGTPRLLVWVKARARDDRTHDADVLYALWAEPGAIDYTKPPRGMARIYDDGRDVSLAYGNTDGDDDVDLPKTRTFRIGIRALDLAGNASAPSELSVP